MPAVQQQRLSIPEVRGSSPEAVFTAALATLLARYSGQSPTPLLARHASHISPLLLETAPETTPREMLERCEPARLDGGGIPGVAPRDLHAARATAIDWLEPGQLPGPRELPGDVPLQLAVSAQAGEQSISLQFDPQRAPAAGVRRLSLHLRELLARLPGYLDAPISTIPLLAAGEKAELEKLCDGALRPAGRELAHQLFEQQAARAPDSVALRFRDRQLSYRELNQRANLLAHRLISRQIGAGCAVAVCCEPSFDILIALLGILKAGATYVPIDPGYPPARIQAVLDDVQPRLILSRDRRAAEGRSDIHLPLEQLAAEYQELSATAELPRQLANPQLDIPAEQTAYIYYTSGTTGHPKGAMATQGNLRHYLLRAQERYGICASDVMPAVARFTFSISMFELLSPLIAGGTLVILEREHVLDPARMARTLSEVTLFHIGPALLKSLVAYIRQTYPTYSAFSRVRHASSGGDKVPPELLESLKEIFANAEVFVIYGCSEISCMGATWLAPRDRLIEETYVGRPFDNVRVRLIDPARNLVPAGALGEVCFCGDGVIQGYLRQPELNQSKFILIDGRRYYRTGDLGRISPEGDLQLVGRQDFQVQLRGMRVEPGEVEHHLRRAPGVRDGVVVAREFEDGEKSLVAYYVAQPEQRAEKALVREYLRERLPDYMVPAIYVELEKLPLNHNLKLDRRSLPEPSLQDRQAGSARSGPLFREPHTELERGLAALWCELLELPRAGLDDQFFELGGDSLRAIELVTRAEAALGVHIEGLELVRETLGTLSAICEARRAKQPLPAPALRRGPARAKTQAPPAEPLELLHFGERQELYGVLHAAEPSPSRALLICAPLGAEALRAQFVLQRLSRRLAAQGVPSLRFDWYGHGDSLGESTEGGLARWRSDLLAARRELWRRTGAKKISALGVRSAALLLAQASPELELDQLIFWDPVCAGAAHIEELSRAQQGYLRNVRFRRRWQQESRAAGVVELAGVSYSSRAVEELSSLSLHAMKLPPGAALDWLDSADKDGDQAEQRRCFELLRGEAPARFVSLPRDCGWGEIGRIEQTLPDSGFTSSIAPWVLAR